MRLYFDINLGYLVSTPGQDAALSGLAFKAGDEASVEVQFGRSNTYGNANALLWTPELLSASSNITIGLKLDTEFTDGTLLAGESDYTEGLNRYAFALNLNTVEINTALGRDGGGTELPHLDCYFEVTYQDGGTGGWNSSTLPVPAIIYHDTLLGDETAPSNATEYGYPSNEDVIVWHPARIGLTGGGATKLDGIATTALAVNYAVALLDESATPDTLRIYRLQSGTTAESSPDVVRPDDFHATTNPKIWVLYTTGGGSGIGGSVGSNDNRIPRSDGTGGVTLQSSVVTISDGGDISTAGSIYSMGDDVLVDAMDYSGTLRLSSTGQLQFQKPSDGINPERIVSLSIDNNLGAGWDQYKLVLPNAAGSAGQSLVVGSVSGETAQLEFASRLASGGALGTPSSGTLTNCTGYPASALPAYWVEVVLTAKGVAIASGTKVAMMTHMQAGTITGFKTVCDPANEPSAAAVQVDLNSVNLSTGAVTSRLSAVASIATGANISTGGTISGTQTVAVGDQSSFDIDQGSDGKELRALVQITPS